MKFISLALMTALSSAYAGSVYDHKPKDIDGKETSLAEHKGKVILMVNVASRCGFTRQYKGLEELHQKFKDKGLVVCAFPCNQFGGQEPGSEKEIKEFCSSKFGVSFPMYSKIDVNGDGAAPLYQWLTGVDSTPEGAGDIKWNFGKFLVGKDGEVLARFEPPTAPDAAEVVSAIEAAL